MAIKSVNYEVIDAFTDTPFKGNPAAVCLLEKEDEVRVDENWKQSVAIEFTYSATVMLTRVEDYDSGKPRFNIRWLTPVGEFNLCGHGTIAATHFLLTKGIVKSSVIEFVSNSGRIVTAKKVDRLKQPGVSNGSCAGEGAREVTSVELDFPLSAVSECDPKEIPSLSATLNGLSIINAVKATTVGDLIIELASGEDVANVQPNIDEILKCPGRGLVITGPAPSGSEFDFFSRFFCPKLAVNEDPVCGSAHCALAPYWGKKLGKKTLTAYMASPRGGRLDLQLEEETQRVRIRGDAVTVMVGTVFI